MLIQLAVPIALSGFHVAITLLALYRARKALRRASQEGKGNRGTLWRLATLRLTAAVVGLSGGLLAIMTPLMLASKWIALPTTAEGAWAILAFAWLFWIPSTVALDNLAIRWIRNSGPGSGADHTSER